MDFVNYEFNVAPSGILYRAPYGGILILIIFLLVLIYKLLCRKLNEKSKILFLNVPYVNYRNHEGQGIHFYKLQTKMHEVLKVYFKYFREIPQFNQLIAKKLLFFIKGFIASDNIKPALLYLVISLGLSLKNIKEIYFWKELILVIKNSLLNHSKLARKIESQMRKMFFLRKVGFSGFLIKLNKTCSIIDFLFLHQIIFANQIQEVNRTSDHMNAIVGVGAQSFHCSPNNTCFRQWRHVLDTNRKTSKSFRSFLKKYLIILKGLKMIYFVNKPDMLIPNLHTLCNDSIMCFLL